MSQLVLFMYPAMQSVAALLASCIHLTLVLDAERDLVIFGISLGPDCQSNDNLWCRRLKTGSSS